MTLGDLTSKQFAMLEKVYDQSKATQRARMEFESEKAGLERSVFNAIGEGVPVKMIAETLGVSVAHVYRMRTSVQETLDRLAA